MTSPNLARSVLPDEKAIAAAVEASRQIAAFVSTNQETQCIELVDQALHRQTVVLPTFALKLLGEILNEMAQGNTVGIAPIHAELTTQEGADMLNVSHPHFVKLLAEGKIPHSKIGSHRRIKLTDIMAYKYARDGASREAMAELTADAQELGLGY